MLVHKCIILQTFLYSWHGSVIADSGRMDVDVENRIAKASKASGDLRRAVFLDKNLSLRPKRNVYQVCIFAVLMECYGDMSRH